MMNDWAFIWRRFNRIAKRNGWYRYGVYAVAFVVIPPLIYILGNVQWVPISLALLCIATGNHLDKLRDKEKL